jgi:hypothetical protein
MVGLLLKRKDLFIPPEQWISNFFCLGGVRMRRVKIDGPDGAGGKQRA